MQRDNMLTQVAGWLTAIVGLLKGHPNNSGLVISQTNTTGMQLAGGVPLSIFPVAATDAEATAIRAAFTAYIDTRSPLLYWTKNGSTWSSVPWAGQSEAWRKNSLVSSTQSHRMFYLDDNLTVTEVDLTSA